MLRAINGHTRVLRLLLSDPSIDVNATNNSSRTALIRAARDGHFEALELLLSFPGIEKNIVDKKNRSALHYAVLLHHKQCV
ncbi:ankyrin repeat protein, putative, partial [Trichomonas vaginalis G3]